MTVLDAVAKAHTYDFQEVRRRIRTAVYAALCGEHATQLWCSLNRSAATILKKIHWLNGYRGTPHEIVRATLNIPDDVG